MTDSGQRPGWSDRGAAADRGWSTIDRSPRAVYVAGLRRRRATAWRCPPLECGHRDPLTCVAGSPASWSAAELDAWAAAVAHLAGVGHDVSFAVPAAARGVAA